MKKQTKSSWQTTALTAIAIVLTFGAFSGAAAAQEKKSPGERYGSREPQTCENQKAPAKGAITAALAAKYFICKAEGISGQYLYLVENVRVEVGGGIPYAAIIGHRSFPEVDVKHPVYPIRGSVSKYQCKDPQTDYINIEGRTCNLTEEPNAKGYCYKTTFGDWSCYMLDLDGKNENYFPDVAPPGGKTAAGNKAAANDKPADAKTPKQTAETKDEPNAAADKDENGFVKPDFSEMEKYFDIIRYEYVFTSRDLYIVGKMKKANNPNKWLVEFFDADGARLKWGNTVLHHTSGPDPQVGQVVKMYAGTPTEKQMRDEVKKIVVTRILD